MKHPHCPRLLSLLLAAMPLGAAERPNILFIMTDDHAAHAISAYGSKINTTPNLDRLAREGMRFDRCFAVNSICTPSRASILTGKYSHRNGVPVFNRFDGSLIHFWKKDQWECYDLSSDPRELRNIYGDPAAADTVAALKRELWRLKAELQDNDEFADAQPPPGVDGQDFSPPPATEKGARDR